MIKSLKDGSFYTGISQDPKKRLVVHNQGSVKSSAAKRPYNLVYIKEHNNYIEARRHEKWLKKKNTKYKKHLVGL